MFEDLRGRQTHRFWRHPLGSSQGPMWPRVGGGGEAWGLNLEDDPITPIIQFKYLRVYKVYNTSLPSCLGKTISMIHENSPQSTPEKSSSSAASNTEAQMQPHRSPTTTAQA